MIYQIKEILASVFVLSSSLLWKEEFTPDFFHFVTLLHEDYVHLIWVFILWSTYKSWFTVDDASGYSFKAYIFFSFLEMVLGFLIASELSIRNLVLYSIFIAILVLRSMQPKITNTFLLIFIFLYLTQNCIVNAIDFMVFKKPDAGYYHDDQFLKSFSFKVY